MRNTLWLSDHILGEIPDRSHRRRGSETVPWLALVAWRRCRGRCWPRDLAQACASWSRTDLQSLSPHRTYLQSAIYIHKNTNTYIHVHTSEYTNMIKDLLIDRSREREENIRETEHNRSTVLLSDETSELPLGLINRLQVFLTHSRVTLRHS